MFFTQHGLTQCALAYLLNFISYHSPHFHCAQVTTIFFLSLKHIKLFPFRGFVYVPCLYSFVWLPSHHLDLSLNVIASKASSLPIPAKVDTHTPFSQHPVFLSLYFYMK
jgi:hypothetical protein